MAIKIKLTRIGKRNDPKYRIIIAEEHSKRDGKYIDKIGFYDPIKNPHILDIDMEKLKDWIKKGAKFTQGTKRLLEKLVK